MSNSSTVELPPAAGDSPPLPPHPRHRRGWWIALIAAAATLVLVVPLALYLALRGNGSPAGGTATPGAAVSAPAATPTQPAAPTTAAQAVPQRPPAPDGRISYDQLKNATLDIPAWPADNLTGVSGQLKFTDGQVKPPGATYVIALGRTPVYGDVDRDGALETVVSVGCYVQGGSQQLVAFDRDTAGRIVTLGTVVATTGPVRTIAEPVTINPAGVVTVTVADFQGCCGDDTPTMRQVRQYGWNGHRFAQVGGPTAFPANPHVTETGASTGELVFGPATGGVRHGTLTVTVTYLYGTAPDHLEIAFSAPAQIAPDGAWPATHPSPYGTAVDEPTPAAGASATYTFAFTAPATLPTGDMYVSVFGMTKANVRLSESNPFNVPKPVAYRAVD